MEIIVVLNTFAIIVLFAVIEYFFKKKWKTYVKNTAEAFNDLASKTEELLNAHRVMLLSHEDRIRNTSLQLIENAEANSESVMQLFRIGKLESQAIEREIEKKHVINYIKMEKIVEIMEKHVEISKDVNKRLTINENDVKMVFHLAADGTDGAFDKVIKRSKELNGKKSS